MAANITASTIASLVAAVRLVRDRIQGVLQTGQYQDAADDLTALAGTNALPLNGREGMTTALASHRATLNAIRDDGRAIVTPILVQMGREVGSSVVNGERVTDLPRLFREIRADLLGGTPDYVDARAVAFASNPSPSATGIFRRLTTDVDGEPIEDGYHNGTKTIRITSKPARNRSIALITGEGSDVADFLDYRGGRPVVTAGLQAVNDANAPTGSVINPYLLPSDLTDEADITSISSWTINTTGTPVFKQETTAANLWRARPGAIRFTGDNTEAIELVQNIPANVFGDPWRPWDIGVPIKLESGWQGTIDITWGGKTQQFTHSNLTAGSYVHLFPDLDEDLYPVNFDANGAQFKLKFTNSQNNSQSIWCAGFLMQAMLRHEGIWYSHWSHADEPTVDSVVELADTCSFAGKIQDILSFLFHDLAPGDAHFPTSGSTTIDDPVYAPEIALAVAGSNVADGGTIALGTVGASSPHETLLVFTNTGNKALIIEPPTADNDTNATLTDDGMTQAILIEPGESAEVIVEVTDGGAGAFTIDLHFVNTDSNENPFDITISGTAS